MAGTGARPIDRSLRLAALEAGESGANLGQPRPATRVVGMAVGVGTGTGVGVGTGIGIIVSVGALLALRGLGCALLAPARLAHRGRARRGRSYRGRARPGRARLGRACASRRAPECGGAISRQRANAPPAGAARACRLSMPALALSLMSWCSIIFFVSTRPSYFCCVFHSSSLFFLRHERRVGGRSQKKRWTRPRAYPASSPRDLRGLRGIPPYLNSQEPFIPYPPGGRNPVRKSPAACIA